METSTRGAPTFGRPLFWNCVCRRRLDSLSALNHCFNSRLSELSACEVTSEWTRVAVVTRPFLLSRVCRWPHAIINVLLTKPQCIDEPSERNVLLNGLFSNTLVGEHTCVHFKMSWVPAPWSLYATQMVWESKGAFLAFWERSSPLTRRRIIISPEPGERSRKTHLEVKNVPFWKVAPSCKYIN